MKRLSVIFILCILLFTSFFMGFEYDAVENSLDRDTEKRIDQVFSHFNNSTPGVAVAIVKDGEVVYKKGFGMSNLEYDIPILPSSIFHIASISKQFTTMSVVLLAQQGKLSLDDDIRTYIPEVPDFGKTITIRHLAHHISGIRDQWQLLSLAGWRRNDLKTQEDVLDLVKRQKELNFNPGEEYLYCNTGFTLLAILVDRVTGMTMREFADQNIFKPLGMNSTHFHNDMSEIVKFRTSAYVPGHNGSFRISIPNFNTYGATSLFTTVEDLALWEQNFVHKRVGGEDGLRKLLTKGILNNGDEINYALGISHGTYRGLRTLGHTGSDSGYRSAFRMFPDQKVSVIIFANVSNANPSGLANEVADILLESEFTEDKPKRTRRPQRETPEKPELSEKQLEEYTGRYYSEELDVFFTIILKNEALWLERRKFPTQEMFPCDTDEFMWDNDRIEFDRNSNSKITGFKLSSGRVRNLHFDKMQ